MVLLFFKFFVFDFVRSDGILGNSERWYIVKHKSTCGFRLFPTLLSGALRAFHDELQRRINCAHKTHTHTTHRHAPNQVRCVLLGTAKLFLFIWLTNRSEGTAFNLQVGPVGDYAIPIFHTMWFFFFLKGCKVFNQNSWSGVRDDAVFPLWGISQSYLKLTLSLAWQCVKAFYLLLSAAPST